MRTTEAKSDPSKVDGSFASRAETLHPKDSVFVDREPTAESPALAQLALQERADDRQGTQDERLDRPEERQIRQESRQARYQLVQTVIGAASAVASVIFALIALGR